VTPIHFKALRKITHSVGLLERRVAPLFQEFSKTRVADSKSEGLYTTYRKFLHGSFRPEGCGAIPSASRLANILRQVQERVDTISYKERWTRSIEVSRLVWSWSTICAVPPSWERPGMPRNTQMKWFEVVLLGLRWMALDAAGLIAAFKDVTTKLVQLGVTDLSPARVTRREAQTALAHLTGGLRHSRNARPGQLIARACVDPGFAIGLLQSKRCAGPLREDQVAAKMAANLKLLTTEQLQSDPKLESVLVEEVKRTVAEIRRLKPKWTLAKALEGPANPDTSACFEYPRKKGGSLGYWVDNWYEKYPGEAIDDTEIPCRRAGVLEPFKLRVISAGKAAAYSRLALYQKSLWRLLKSIPTFSLIGTPLTERHIQQWWKTARRLYGNSALALSGDYSAATDNLNPRLSRAVLESLIDEGMDDYDLLIAGLTGHIIDPDHTGKSPHKVGTKQRWGQLMGSPISFPILCIVNAAMCRYVVEQDSGRELDLSEAGVLVNGDDCLVPISSPERYEAWANVVSVGGLLPSPGKCFLSCRYAQLNSTTYRGESARLVPFLRTNLLWGLRSKGTMAGKDEMKISADRAYLPNCLFKVGWTKRQYAYIRRSFREISRPYLEATRPIPLHLHPSWGGLGIPYLRKRGSADRIGPDQLKAVAWLMTDPIFLEDWHRRLKLAETPDPTGLLGRVAKAEIAWRGETVAYSSYERRKKPGPKISNAPLSYVLSYLAKNGPGEKTPEETNPVRTLTLRAKVKKLWKSLLRRVSEEDHSLVEFTARLLCEDEVKKFDLLQLAREGSTYTTVRIDYPRCGAEKSRPLYRDPNYQRGIEKILDCLYPARDRTRDDEEEGEEELPNEGI